MSDDEAVSFLSNINGVGVWTAEMLIMFSLGRENVFSYNDVALRNGIKKAKKYKTLSKKRFETLREKYILHIVLMLHYIFTYVMMIKCIKLGGCCKIVIWL